MKNFLVSILLFVAVLGHAADGFLYNTAGTLGLMPSSPGSGTNAVYEHTLSNAVAVGATSVFLDRAARFPATDAGFLVIGVGTTNQEIRPATTVSGHQVTFTGFGGLTFAHAAAEIVLWIADDFTDLAYGGVVASSSVNAGLPLRNVFEQAGNAGKWIGGGANVYTELPFVVPNSTRIRNLAINAKAGYPTTHTNAWMLTGRQGASYAFTGDAATDVITISGGWDPPPGLTATNVAVAFYATGTNVLPTPLVPGVLYFVRTNSSTALQIKYSPYDATALDITTNGTGVMASEAGSGFKIYLQDVNLHGQAQPSVNGIWLNINQPTYLGGYFRVDNAKGTAMWLTGQQGDFENVELIECGVGLDLRKGPTDATGAQFMYFKALNIERCTNSIILGGGNNLFVGTHIENSFSDTAPIVDGSLEASSSHFISFALGSEPGSNTVFLMGTTNFSANYILEDINILAPAVDGPQLVLNDQYRNHRIFTYSTTNGGGRYFTRIVAPAIPSSEVYSSKFSGDTMLGLKGRYSTLGQQHQHEAFHIYQGGTNDSGPLIQFQRSNGTTNMGFTADGSLSARQGPSARAGNVVLVGGTITTNNPSVTANTVAILTRKTAGGTIGNLSYSVSAGTSLTIASDSGTDTSTVSYLLIENPTP